MLPVNGMISFLLLSCFLVLGGKVPFAIAQEGEEESELGYVQKRNPGDDDHENNGEPKLCYRADLEKVDLTDLSLGSNGHYNLIFDTNPQLQCFQKHLTLDEQCSTMGTCTFGNPSKPETKVVFHLHESRRGLIHAEQRSPQTKAAVVQMWYIVLFKQNEGKKYVCCSICDDCGEKVATLHCMMEKGGKVDYLQKQVNELKKKLKIDGEIHKVWSDDKCNDN